MHDSDPSRQPVLIHLHVPKCAGVSVSQALTRRFGARATGYDRRRKTPATFLAMTPAERDARYDCVFGHIPFGEHRLFGRPPVYISATRDPLERICSFFNFAHTRPNHPMHALLKARLRDLNDLTPAVATEPVLVRPWRNAFCRVYGGIETALDDAAYQKVERRVAHALKSGRLYAAPLPQIAALLRAIGIEALPHANRTDATGFDDFAPATPASLSPRTQSLLEDAFCRRDRALLAMIDRTLDDIDGATFARQSGLDALAPAD